MSQIELIITRLAHSDLARIYGFLNDLGATKQANMVMQLLSNSFGTTQNNPKNGKSYDLLIDGELLANVREVIVPYGKSGYSYLFYYDENDGKVFILTIKHFRENNYRLDLLVFN